eukprot:COSAG06_NODE_50174_length_320_cov_1.027149_1_plen_69_part_00
MINMSQGFAPGPRSTTLPLDSVEPETLLDIVDTRDGAPKQLRFSCGVVVMAHGLGVPHQPTDSYQRLK